MLGSAVMVIDSKTFCMSTMRRAVRVAMIDVWRLTDFVDRQYLVLQQSFCVLV